MNFVAIVLDAFLVVAATVVMVSILGVLSRRTLGIRISNSRIMIAGLFGVGAGLAFESQFVWKAEAYTPAVLPILLGIIVFVSLSFLVIAELLIPQGSIPGPNKWLPLTKGAISRNKRYAQILKIAAKHRLFNVKLGPAATELTSAERKQQALSLKLALEEAGGAFVKLGQLLSTRPDVIPAEFLEALTTLQQEVAPEPWELVEPALDRSLKKTHKEVFASFDEVPFASASIGQVHHATLATGQEVAVKVRRPGIDVLVERDIDIAKRWARRFARNNDKANQFGVEQLVDNLAERLREELDYEAEAANILTLIEAQKLVAAEAQVRIPKLVQEFSSGDVLVMEFISGSTLSTLESVNGLTTPKRRKLAEQLLAATLGQIMEAGVFHADLHPGNVIITEDGELVLLDFGSVGRIDSETRKLLGEVMFAFSKRDATGFANGLIEFVDLTDGQDEESLRRTISNFLSRRLGPGGKLDASTFSEIVSILSSHGLTVPPEVTVPFHAIATVEGSLMILDSDFDLVAEAGSYAQRRIEDEMHPMTMARNIGKELLSTIPILKRMPQRFDRMTSQMVDGRFSLNLRLVADARDRSFFREIIGLGVVAFLAGIFGVMGALLLVSENGPQLTDSLTLFQVFGYLFMLISGILTLRALFDVLRRRIK